LHSVDFHEIDQLQGQDAWEALGPVLLDAAQVPWPAFDSMRLHAEAAAAQLWTNDVSRAVFVDEWIFGAA
jgi:aspartate/glutamate racemase